MLRSLKRCCLGVMSTLQWDCDGFDVDWVVRNNARLRHRRWQIYRFQCSSELALLARRPEGFLLLGGTDNRQRLKAAAVDRSQLGHNRGLVIPIMRHFGFERRWRLVS